MAKVELRISGMSHQAIEDAVINAGLLIRKKTHRVGDESYISLVGGKIGTQARHTVGEFQHMRGGLTLRLDPTEIPPSSLAALLSIVGK